ncbi:hypothetical protein FSP39_014395 [Pinctada imbricata]|uniref:Death domain-containing protein n=1 Tax=Pinctada imbricata TaxID=66713 RepID=A0AA88YCQ1_PINIB|nr:hypothetical protein FSP39_014395 [Pinctada imbricata]
MAMREGFGQVNKTRIQRNYELLCTDIELSEIIDPFISDGYFDLDIEDDIKAEANPPTSKNINKVFLKKLIKCSDSAYDLFRTTLLQKGYSHIVEFLDNTVVQSANSQPKPKRKDRVKELSKELNDLTLDDRSVMKFNLVIGKDIDIFGKTMGFAQAEIDQIKMENTYSTATQMHKLFTKWRNRYGQSATLGLLVENLQDAELGGAEVHWDQYDLGLERVKELHKIK